MQPCCSAEVCGTVALCHPVLLRGFRPLPNSRQCVGRGARATMQGMDSRDVTPCWSCVRGVGALGCCALCVRCMCAVKRALRRSRLLWRVACFLLWSLVGSAHEREALQDLLLCSCCTLCLEYGWCTYRGSVKSSCRDGASTLVRVWQPAYGRQAKAHKSMTARVDDVRTRFQRTCLPVCSSLHLDMLSHP